VVSVRARLALFGNLLITQIMEQLNSVELRGNVGGVKYLGPKEKPMVIFTLATNKTYTSSDGTSLIDTTWHNVVAYESKDVKGVEFIDKGKKVIVKGRIRNQKFTGSDGVEHYTYDILANKLEILPDSEVLVSES